MAVTVGGHVHNQADVEGGSAGAEGVGILGDFAAEQIQGVFIHGVDGVECAGTDASAAALALVVVDHGLLILTVGDGIAAALLGAASAAAAEVLVHSGLALTVLLHLAGSASAAHADVLQRAAEAGHLMALEVRQGDQNVCVHQRSAHEGGFAVFPVGHGNFNIVGAAQAVSNDDVAAGGDGVEAVELRIGQVVNGVGEGTGVEGVAVRQEGHAAQLLHHVGNRLHIVGAEIGTVAQLAEVHFDGDKLVVKINLFNARCADELLQLGALANPDLGPKIGKEYIRFFHR